MTRIWERVPGSIPHDPAEVGQGCVRLTDAICRGKHAQQPFPLALHTQSLGSTLLKPQGCCQGDVIDLQAVKLFIEEAWQLPKEFFFFFFFF